MCTETDYNNTFTDLYHADLLHFVPAMFVDYDYFVSDLISTLKTQNTK